MKILNLVMIVKNEERCLKRCLESVKELVDNIIIVDTGSTDGTKEIASSFGAKIYDFLWIQDFSAARNYALDKSDADWNLILDADEFLSSGKREEINNFLEDKTKLGAIKRIDAYMDGTEVSYGINFISRLIPKGVRFTGRIHEQAVSDLPRVPLPLEFEHDGYLLFNKGERNISILRMELEAHPEDSYFLYQIGISLRNMNRHEEAVSYLVEFYRLVPSDANYRSRGIVAYLYSLIEIQRYDSALLLIEAEHKALSPYADFSFACGIFYMKLVLSNTKKYISYLPRIEESYLHCLDIGEIPEDGGVLGTGSFKANYNLGTWYEVAGDLKKAKYHYTKAAQLNYMPAIKRVKELSL